MEHNLPPPVNIPPIDLDQFVSLAKPKILQIPILRRLRYLRYSEGYKKLKSLSCEKEDTRFFEIVFRNRRRSLKISLFDTAGGHYSVFIEDHRSMAGHVICVGRYFELYDKDSEDRRCFILRSFPGALEKQVEESLACINRVLETTFESVLEGDDWIDIPPSFYDYK